MLTIIDFLDLLADELGVDPAAADLDRPLQEVPGWDSVLLLKLLTVLERTTHQRQSLPALLQARTVRQLHAGIRAA